MGCVITDAWYGWYLNTLAIVAYLAVVVDTVVLTAERIVYTSQPILKGYSVIIKECVFVIYACVWLMGNWGYASSYACQRFYAVSDVSLKSTMAFLMFFFWANEEADTTQKVADVNKDKTS